MTMLRVRVELADVPGALAVLTTAVAALGVDVAAVDVLEVDGRSVVDEVLLRLPQQVSAQEVRDVLRVSGADVLSCREVPTARDPAVAALELAGSVLMLEEQDLGAALAGVAYADAGALVPVEEAGRYPLALRALADGVPATGPAGPVAAPLPLAAGWVLWVAPQVPEAGQLAVVGRRMDVRFAATEAARLRALVTLLEQVRRVRA
jgi:hypothetical protein